jgi:hypothetical protein
MFNAPRIRHLTEFHSYFVSFKEGFQYISFPVNDSAILIATDLSASPLDNNKLKK